VNVAITQMDQVTQQNAALVEEASAAAQSMSEQASELVQAVSVFKLGADMQAPQAAAQPRAAAAAAGAPPPAAIRSATSKSARTLARKTQQPARQLALANSDAGDWKEF
jgi:methyl-accepting chemotaxis protein